MITKCQIMQISLGNYVLMTYFWNESNICRTQNRARKNAITEMHK